MNTLDLKSGKVTDVREAENIVVRFSGDSGDGMQLTGTQFTDTSAFLGQDISTFPEFPAEIRSYRNGSRSFWLSSKFWK